jgi:hypothetical protein
VRLLALHPEFAGRSCDDCKRWVYEDSGAVKRVKRHELRAGRVELVLAPMARQPNQPTPCHDCPKIPEGRPKAPEGAEEWAPRHWRTWQHYLECAAVNWRVPEATDPTVRRNARVISRTLELCREVTESRRHRQLLRAVALREL